jgi:long-chain fatty acid transport protein
MTAKPFSKAPGPHLRAILLACTGTLAAGQAVGGGVLLYEIGTADVGLAAAGYGARAQDASTVFTNPAGMTRLDGTQVLVGGQLLWANTKFSIGSGTSALLGNEDGGYAIGADGWFPGGGGFLSYSVSPDLKLGLALTGNFGLGLDYDDDWVGRYYAQKAVLLGISLVPAIAYRVNDQLSLGASLNAMYGVYKNEVAVNNRLVNPNINPNYPDGQLELDDTDWGFGANLGLLYEVDERTRLGLTWSSQVDLNFESRTKFSGLAPGLQDFLGQRGLLNTNLKIGINVPQQVMGSVFSQIDDRWALLGSVGWQQWSKFGQVDIGVDNSNNSTRLTTNLDFEDTWHFSVGAQYRVSEPWLINFGIAYDTAFQDSSEVSPLLPANSAWRFGAGAQQQLSPSTFWGFALEYAYGGTLDTELRSKLPVEAGGRGDVVGSFEDTGIIFATAYFSWKF